MVTALACGGAQPEQSRRLPVSYYQPAHQVSGVTGGMEPASADRGAECKNAPNQLFPADAWFNRSVAAAPQANDSDAIVQFLEANHRAGGKFQVDFSLVLLEARGSTPRRKFEPNDRHYSPDCDLGPVPLPRTGRIEGEQGFACEGQGDCHLLVLDRQECRLYEMFSADLRGGSFNGGCLAVWNVAERYPANGRGDDCTSADAAGLPIAPLLFDAEDIARGEIAHALRFVLPNALIRQLVYVPPGTHSTKATSGPKTAPPYAALLRLKGDVDLSTFKPPARVVLAALQRYGMYLADAGKVTFTAESDSHSELKWSDVGFGPQDLKGLRWTDFEVVDTGAPRTWKGSCKRAAAAK